MRFSHAAVAAILIAFGCYAGAGFGATLLFDDFEGSALDGSKWGTVMSAGSAATVSNSELVVATTQGDWPFANVYSSTGFDTGTATFKIGNTAMAGAINFGLHIAQGGGQIGMEIVNDYGGGWQFWVSDGTNRYLSSGFAAPKAGETWSIVRKTDSIALYANGSLLATDTTVLPVGEQRLHMSVYTGNGASSVGFGSVEFSTVVPEPSAGIIAFLGASGLLAYAWRKRR